MESSRVETDDLRRRVDPEAFGFETTGDVEPLERTVGQPRALSALDFGLEISTRGYNIFATGPIGTGKRTTLEAHLREHAARSPAPEDRLYLFDFTGGDRPQALALPPGRGAEFADGMRRFVEEARRRIPEAFESENYQERRGELAEEIGRKREEVLGEVREFAVERNLALELTPAGLVTIPLVEGRPIPPAEFRELPEPQRREFQDRIEEVESRMPAALNRLRQIEREGTEQIRDLDREVAMFAVGHIVDEIKDGYAEVEGLDRWLESVREDVIEHLDNFRSSPSGEEGMPAPMAAGMRHAREEFFSRYEPNVLVSHSDDGGAPVVYETNPTYYNLFGRIEYEATFGALSTDHRHIKPGALHRANGGYLMLDALNVLTEPFAWTRLKEALRTGRVGIEAIGAQLTLFPTATLEPEPIDLEVKVILVGPPRLYALLHELDEDLRKLFKVRVDFGADMPLGGRSVGRVRRVHRPPGSGRGAVELRSGCGGAGRRARLEARATPGEALDAVSRDRRPRRPVEPLGAARRRRAGRGRSRQEGDLGEGLPVEPRRGAGRRARRRGHAADRRRRRARRRGQRARRGEGRRLRVRAPGPDHRQQRAGKRGRGQHRPRDEAERPAPRQGVLDPRRLSPASLRRRAPALAASEPRLRAELRRGRGDSASGAELFALLSSLADVPIRVGIAVTGSVNQHGRLQAIGGVNEKIEGFFRVCEEAGLTGDQGVLIPAANRRHLMLREEVVDACRDGRFNVWAVETVDEGLGILTGVPAGERGVDGTYPEGSIHRLIEDRLDRLAELGRQFAATDGDQGAGSGSAAEHDQ